MEKRELVDQKDAARFERVRSYLVAHPALFSTQGSVVASWRTYRGRRLGPYFRVSYRHRGRQRSMYLGCSERIARLVRLLLAHLQTRHRQRRLFARLIGQARSSLRACKADLKRQLAEWGIQLKGFEFRGAARLLRRRYPRRPPSRGKPDAGTGAAASPGPTLAGNPAQEVLRAAACGSRFGQAARASPDAFGVVRRGGAW